MDQVHANGLRSQQDFLLALYYCNVVFCKDCTWFSVLNGALGEFSAYVTYMNCRFTFFSNSLNLGL